MLIAIEKKYMVMRCDRCGKRIKFGYSKWQLDAKVYYCSRCAIILKIKRLLRYIDVNAQENEVGHSQHELGIKQKLNVKEEKSMSNGWETGFVIKTPKGDYKPKSDDLAAEIKTAARYAGVKHPHVSVGFDTIESPADLPVACISGLDEGTVVEVSVYDEAGK